VIGASRSARVRSPSTPVRGLDYVILDPRHRMPRRYLQKPGPMNPEIWFNAPH
jgi:hypothetical protein